jgi:hypothetical protein
VEYVKGASNNRTRQVTSRQKSRRKNRGSFNKREKNNAAKPHYQRQEHEETKK